MCAAGVFEMEMKTSSSLRARVPECVRRGHEDVAASGLRATARGGPSGVFREQSTTYGVHVCFGGLACWSE